MLRPVEVVLGLSETDAPERVQGGGGHPAVRGVQLLRQGGDRPEDEGRAVPKGPRKARAAARNGCDKYKLTVSWDASHLRAVWRGGARLVGADRLYLPETQRDRAERLTREFEGRGYVHADDVVNAGFVQGETSHVAVQVVYDELAILDDYEGVDITRVTRELKPENPLGLNLMRITVDGEPIDDPKRSSSDIQRCTDVAMKVADIQFGFDNLRSAPRLSVSATPSRIALSELMHVGPDLSPANVYVDRQATPVRFMMYTNYAHFIDRAEVRVFETGQSLESEPLAVVPVGEHGLAEWLPQADWFRAPVFELAYVLRAYGKGGKAHSDIYTAQVADLLREAPGVQVLDGVETGQYPTAVTESSGADPVFVGRIREDISHPRGIDLWVVADNIRKGAALNSVQIAEILAKNYL